MECRETTTLITMYVVKCSEVTTRTNLSLYDEPEIVQAIRKFQDQEELPSFTFAATKLVKEALRARGILDERV